VRDVLLIVDVFQDFAHDHGAALLRSLRQRRHRIAAAVSRARESGTPLVYANDHAGLWDSDVSRIVDRALGGPGSDVVASLLPEDGDRFVLKPRYSAFDHTPLELILEELECERVLIAGASTEGCVAQTAIDARERGYYVSVVASGCATTDEALEQTALRYLVDVVGVRLLEPTEVGRSAAPA
jgi:nicotinamidase-related amidase